MKKKKFKQATSTCSCVYVNRQKNTIIMKFKPNPWDILLMMIGFPIWVGTPIEKQGLPSKKNLDARVARTAFVKEED